MFLVTLWIYLMTSLMEARFRSEELQKFRERRGGKVTEAECAPLRASLVEAASQVVSRECKFLVDDFQRCFKHGFRLPHCDESVTNKLLACHRGVVSRIHSV
eukprot:GHVS01061532.1.p2 GENE.GHVS01061532.1~~GHVS01061532.1.p2  ORF type:complete len:102 (-),score=14.54 GHVS01061532.1:192-497(-)